MSDQPTSKPTPRPTPKSPAPAKPQSPAPATTNSSPVFGVTIALGLALIVYVVMQLPYGEDPGTLKRLGTACVATFVGLMIYSAARAMIESILKALVEIVAASVFVIDALIVLLVVYWKDALTEWGVGMGMAEPSAFAIIAVSIAAAMFIINALIFLLLHPLSRVVGTEIVIR